MQRIVGEMLFPEPRRQFGNPSDGVFPDALEHIDEIRVRIDAVQSAGDDQFRYATDEAQRPSEIAVTMP